MATSKHYEAGEWLVEATKSYRELIIDEGAVLKAPEDKGLTLSVNGVGTQLRPGTYRGDVVLTVHDYFKMPPSGLFRKLDKPVDFRAALVIKDGKIIEAQGVPSMLQGGSITPNEINGVTIYDNEESFNGIIIDGDSEVTIENVTLDFEGAGGNDFMGVGAGITTIGNSKVHIRNCDLMFACITRCDIHAGGNSEVWIDDCRMVNCSPATDRMEPAWMLGLRGTNRALQLCDNAIVHYNNCYLRGNGWGVFSIDGVIKNRMYVSNSTIDLIGPRARGYGAFAIGDSIITYDHCKVFVNGYPILMNTEEGGGAEYLNGTEITGPLYGALIFRDNNGHFYVKDSSMDTGRSSFVVKGSNTNIHLERSVIKAGNGVILQLMDNDDVGHGTYFKPPIGKIDVYEEGRDLTAAVFEKDVFMDITDMEVEGDFLNSSTNLRANDDTEHIAHFAIGLKGEGLTDTLVESREAHPDEEEEVVEDDLQGAKNLELKLVRATVKGVISSALQRYYDGVTVIDSSNSEELSNVIQTPAPTVNNGVIVLLDAGSKWIVTGTSYITKLVIEEGAQVVANSMTVDGASVAIAPGAYVGRIVLNG